MISFASVCFKPKISSPKLIGAKSVPKCALSKTGSNSLSQHKIMKKLQKRMKNKFSNIAYQVRWSVGDDFKIIISTKSNTVESNHSDESDIRRIYNTFWKNVFRPKYIDLVRSVQSCSVNHAFFSKMASEKRILGLAIL